LASDPDQEYIYFVGSETLPSTCYILSDESSLPLYSTSNWYKKGRDHEEASSETLLGDTKKMLAGYS